MPDSTENPLYEFPVSSTQATFWYMYQMDPDNTAYTIPLGFRITGPLHDEILRQSIEIVVSRHEILRTTYSEKDDGSLVQVVSSCTQVPFEVIEVDGNTSQARQKRLDVELEREFRRPLRIDKEPVIRVRLFRLGVDEHVLLLVGHHIAFDHMAFGIFLEEMAEQYRRLTDGSDESLTEPELQYADYVIWQREQIESFDHSQRYEIWQNRLAQFSGVLDLPTTFKRQKFQTFEGRDYYFELSSEISKTASEFSRTHGLSMFVLLLACWQAVYQRYSGQNDIIIGTPFSDRNQDQQLEPIMGCFINTLPLAVRIRAGTSFLEHLQNVKEVMMEAFDNQIVPLEDIVHTLGIKRDVSRAPLFQTGFVFQDPPMSFQLPGADVSVIELKNFGSMYDLHTFMWESKGRLNGVITYDTSLFDEHYVARLLATFEAAALNLMKSPQLDVQQVPMLCADDAQIQARANSTQVAFPDSDSVVDLFRKQAQDSPSKVAAAGFDGELSYADLEANSNAVARLLKSKGVGQGQFVGVAMDRGSRMIAVLIGVWKAGAAYVPLDPEYPADRLSYMMETAEISALLTQESLRSRMPRFDCVQISLDEEWDEISSKASVEFQSCAGSDDIAYVIFTSGSTGKPKGVQIQHRAVVNFLSSMAKRPGLSSRDTLLAVTTLSFDISVLELFLPLSVGATTVIATAEQSGDGKQLLSLIDQHDVTVMQATPSTWRLLLAEGWLDDSNDWTEFKVLCGGEALPKDLAKTLTDGVSSVWNMYGPTETTVWSACKRLHSDDACIQIGKPIDNTGIHILNPCGQPVPIGVPGALHISGDGLSLGYLNRDDLTEQSFYEHPADPGLRVYATGDIAVQNVDGNIAYLHREDGQVKLRGYRIELGEIESILAAEPGVSGVVASVWSGGGDDNRLVAYIIPEGTRINVMQLRKALRNTLPGYMVPQHFVEIGEFPMTNNGKINRGALPSPVGVRRATERKPPASEVEIQVASIWSQILGEKQVYLDDHFFDIGGHSLLAVKVISRIEKELGVRLNPRNIVMQSLAEIAGGIDQAVSSHATAS